MDEDVQGIVLDFGSGLVKAGFAGDDSPRVCISNIVGVSEHGTFYGEDVLKSDQSDIDIKYPMEEGEIKNWDHFEKFMSFLYESSLKINFGQNPVLATEAPYNSKNNREKMCCISFESFNVPAFYIAISGVLSLYASGRTTGVVLDIGDTQTHTMPIYEGYVFDKRIRRIDLGGRDITNCMVKILGESGYKFPTPKLRFAAKTMKEKICYVASDYENELNKCESTSSLDKEYTLPDGSSIIASSQRFRAPEILFKPNFVDKHVKGVHELVYKTIYSCNMFARKDFLSNIVLSGGTTLTENFVERISSEIQSLAPKNARVKVNSPSERLYSCWIGGSILGSLSTFQNMWITRDEYDDAGATIIHRKCF